jgi:protein-ribulosamine 3-kinase
MTPEAVKTWLVANQFGTIVSERPVSGGCINNGLILKTESGKSFFLKINFSAPPDMFAKEANGLDAIRVDGGPAVPEPYHFGPDFLVMEDLSPAPRRSDYWTLFGQQLATLHQHTEAKFGFAEDNYIGSTPQPNVWMEDGHEFFGERRFLFQAGLARERGLLGEGDYRDVEKLVARLPHWVPDQPPSLIHGDLWTGNAIADSRGSPAIIDPAAHYGWAEAELAMTTLFGSFPGVFYRAYEEIRPLDPGYQSRFPLYNLYHLLNHLNLFGRSYLSQVRVVLRHFV